MLFSSDVFTSTQFHKYDANHVGNIENYDNDDDRDDDDVEDDDNDDNDGDADDALFPPAATCEKKEREIETWGEPHICCWTNQQKKLYSNYW